MRGTEGGEREVRGRRRDGRKGVKGGGETEVRGERGGKRRQEGGRGERGEGNTPQRAAAEGLSG